LITKNFSIWERWEQRNNLILKNTPGIYCIAISKNFLSGKKFKWIEEIQYIGMTHSQAGLKGRLKQFDNTINGKTGHGGADRMLYDNKNYTQLTSKLYVAVCPFPCNVKQQSPADLRTMGEVRKAEYECFAIYSEKFGDLPKYNQSESPKYSKKFKK